MRAFFVACAAAIVLAIGAAYALNSGYIPDLSSTVFSTEAVRI